MASTLNIACTYWRTSDPSSAVTGGYINGGQRNGLTLTMGRAGRVGNESGETAAD